MSIVLDGTTGITTPGLTNTGTETIVNLTTTGNTILGDASTDTLNVGNGGLVKDASGNVGIGVTPVANQSRFQVKQPSADRYGAVIYASASDAFLQLGHTGTVGAVASTYTATAGFTPLTFWTSDTERMRIASTGELTYTKSTLASYVWSGFNPTNVTGTLTNAPATGTIYDTNYVTMANSSGTVTTTFDIAGSYLVTVCVDTKHSFAYTFERTNFNLGGTATRTSPVNQIVFNGIDSNDADTSASISFLVTATAGQTITVLPTYELTGAGTTANHTCYPYITTMYCGG